MGKLGTEATPLAATNHHQPFILASFFALGTSVSSLLCGKKQQVQVRQQVQVVGFGLVHGMKQQVQVVWLGPWDEHKSADSRCFGDSPRLEAFRKERNSTAPLAPFTPRAVCAGLTSPEGQQRGPVHTPWHS